MVNKKDGPPSKHHISSYARRRRRLLRLKRLRLGVSGPAEPSQQPKERKIKSQVEVLYFPSVDNYQSPSVPASSNLDDSSSDTRDDSLPFEASLSPSIIPSTITLFSLSPEPPSPSRPLHSGELTDTHPCDCSPTTSSHRASSEQRVTRSSRSARNGLPITNQSSSVEDVKEETSSTSSYSISNVVSGRRVVDLGIILEKFETIAQHPLECPKGRMVALSEEITSLQSAIHFMCDVCGQERTLESELHLIF